MQEIIIVVPTKPWSVCIILLRIALAWSKYVPKYIPTKSMQYHKAKPENIGSLHQYTKFCKNLAEISEYI